MKDEHIDQDEVVRYGDNFLARAEGYRSLDEIVVRLIDGHRPLLERFKELRAAALDSRSSTLDAQRSRQEVIQETGGVLKDLFDDVAKSAEKGLCNLSRFFVNGSKEHDINRRSSIADRRGAVERCIGGLKQYPEVRDAASWLPKLEDLLARLDALNQRVESGDGAKRVDSSELEAARNAWEVDYRANHDILRGLLRKAGRLPELNSIFLDLNATRRGAGGAGEAAVEAPGEAEPA